MNHSYLCKNSKAMKKGNNQNRLFEENPQMPPEFDKLMHKRDQLELNRKQYEMLIKQEKEIKSNRRYLIVSNIIALLSLAVGILSYLKN